MDGRFRLGGQILQNDQPYMEIWNLICKIFMITTDAYHPRYKGCKIYQDFDVKVTQWSDEVVPRRFFLWVCKQCYINLSVPTMAHVNPLIRYDNMITILERYYRYLLTFLFEIPVHKQRLGQNPRKIQQRGEGKWSSKFQCRVLGFLTLRPIKNCF